MVVMALGGLLRRWGRRQPEVLLDPTLGDPVIAELQAAAAEAGRSAPGGGWPVIRGRLEAVPDGQGRTWLLDHVDDVAGVEEWIQDVVKAEPESALPLLVAGARQVAWAWEARTGAEARHVSREQFKVFHERLRVAEDMLYEVAEREPEWVAPWYYLQTSGRGLQVGAETARLRYEASVRRDPWHLGVHRQQLQQVCAKWSGSHEQMHAFARESMLAAPEGSSLGELVAVAHLEHWLDLESGEDAEYVIQDHVSEQLHEAADRSVRHPDYDRDGKPPGWIQTYNVFAMAFSFAQEKEAAAEMFAAIGGTVTKFPWSYINHGDPTEPFRHFRSKYAR
jgi:hypothetical protein